MTWKIIDESTSNFKSMVDEFPVMVSEDTMYKVCPECNPVEESEKNVPIWTITMLEIVNRGNDEESSEDATPEEYTKTYYDADEAWDDAEKLVDEYKDEEGYFTVDIWEGEYETPSGDIINSDDIYDIFHMLTGTEGYQGHILFDEHSSVTCDGCGREVHDDTVEIVGDKVLCDRCRKN